MSEPRYGIWIPVYGNCGVMNHPLEPRDASYSRAKNLIQKLNQLVVDPKLKDYINNYFKGTMPSAGYAYAPVF